MTDKDSGTPRVFLARHGETEWSKSGRFTGTTDLELTNNGVGQVLGTGKVIVGPGKLIDQSNIAHAFISPRKRAQKTFDLLFADHGSESMRETKVTTTEKLTEWNYGQYEGLLTDQIRTLRRDHGLDQERPWDIWKDGCEDGENPGQVTDRLDSLIETIKDLQRGSMHGKKPADVIVIAHGHCLRAFVKRWLKFPMEFPLSMMLEPGGVGVLSYQHHNVEEPAVLVGLAFPATKVS